MPRSAEEEVADVVVGKRRRRRRRRVGRPGRERIAAKKKRE